VVFIRSVQVHGPIPASDLQNS